MADQPLIHLRGVDKIYRRGNEQLRVLDSLDLEVQKGEFVALMGPSGSGKSTILNLVGGLDQPDQGQVLFDGEDLAQLGEADRASWRARHVGFIFQTFNLIPVLNAVQNVELPLLLTPLKKGRRREQARTALEIVGLKDRMRHYPKQLSGGEEQRVAIARAIATDPSVLVADEPTGDLDVANAASILDLMQQLNEKNGQTILMVTHDPKAAERAHRTLRLEKGVVAAGGAA